MQTFYFLTLLLFSSFFDHVVAGCYKFPSIEEIKQKYMRQRNPPKDSCYFYVGATLFKQDAINLAAANNGVTLYDVYIKENQPGSPFTKGKSPLKEIQAADSLQGWWQITSRAYAQVCSGKAYFVWNKEKDPVALPGYNPSIWLTDEFDAIKNGETGITSVVRIDPANPSVEIPYWTKPQGGPVKPHLKRATTTSVEYCDLNTKSVPASTPHVSTGAVRPSTLGSTAALPTSVETPGSLRPTTPGGRPTSTPGMIPSSSSRVTLETPGARPSSIPGLSLAPSSILLSKSPSASNTPVPSSVLSTANTQSTASSGFVTSTRPLSSINSDSLSPSSQPHSTSLSSSSASSSSSLSTSSSSLSTSSAQTSSTATSSSSVIKTTSTVQTSTAVTFSSSSQKTSTSPAQTSTKASSTEPDRKTSTKQPTTPTKKPRKGGKV